MGVNLPLESIIPHCTKAIAILLIKTRIWLFTMKELLE